MKLLLTVPEAAVVAKRHPVTVYKWIRDGRLSAERSAKGLLVMGSDVERVAATTRRGRPRNNIR